MHHPAPTSSELGLVPAMYSFSGPTSHPEFDLGSPSTSGHLQRATQSNKYVADDMGIVNPPSCNSQKYNSNTLNIISVSTWHIVSRVLTYPSLSSAAAGRRDLFGSTGGELKMSK